MPERFGDWYVYTGAVHIHTTESDGTKSLEEVVELGRQVGLEFMMFADHMTLSNREQGKEGFYDNILVVIGYEHNDLDDSHHYLLFESPHVYPSNMSAAEYVAAGASDGALGILAHPDEIRTALKEHPAYPWKDWSVEGFTGIELWNQMSEWMEKLTRYNKLAMSFAPRRSMTAPTERILRKWDELNMTRKVVGLAGADAHAFPVKVGPMTVEIFPYKVHFRCLRSHILLPEKMSDDFKIASRQLYDAIRDCRLFFSNSRWGAANRFQFYARSGSEMALCGGSLSSPDGARLYVKLPARASIKLVHNGKSIIETFSDSLEFGDLQTGIYRVEAWKKRRGWIFSNHIRVGV
ncbi:MAG: PHP domain-containing protein [Candidatus Zixiibacteriota bacterium]|nr:MAG: PHP domain-containing protein [candidate division Zixibacteria bacterium]